MIFFKFQIQLYNSPINIIRILHYIFFCTQFITNSTNNYLIIWYSILIKKLTYDYFIISNNIF